MKIDENVPVMIPMMKVKAISLMTPPPKRRRETAASKVVKLVSNDAREHRG